ncbi:MAG: peptidase T [Planctomycetota bacterium]|jgi:tripeptide aminopeptidase
MNAPLLHRERLLDRFLQYVRIGTTANPHTSDYPSSRGQWLLGQLLVEQLQGMGIDDAEQDDNGLVWGTIPATVDGPVPTILFNAHLDTSPEAPGDRCQPQVIENYSGDDIPLGGSEIIRFEETPELADLIGHTLITTDGKTLLGGDDKAGVAAIMEMANHWMERPELPHGPIRVLFTCDEEIGRGAKHFQPLRAKAVAGYTLDGGGEGILDIENFSADMATLHFHGYNIHPALGKGRMVNAIRAVSELVASLPSDRMAPEATDGREGFIHPFETTGTVAHASVQLLLRDFETAKLYEYGALLHSLAQKVCDRTPKLSYDIEIVEQYRNMADRLRSFPIAADLAEKAYQQLGIQCTRGSIRGGTDGAQMTAMGLPTPNLSVGQYNIHSVKEFASLDQMARAVQHAIVLADLWQSHGRS